MRVRVLLFGQFKDYLGAGELEFDLPEGARVESVWQRLCELHEEFGPRRSITRFALDCEHVEASAPLHEGAEVALFPPLAGGSGPEVDREDHIELTHEPIEPARLREELVHPAAGGVVVFEGLVRNHHEGRPVLRLEYEAYEPMAKRELLRISRELRERFPLRRVVLVHRLGRLDIGDRAVYVGVAADHRDAAFGAARAAIEWIKERVPIFKHEFYRDGTSVWVGAGEVPSRTAGGP